VSNDTSSVTATCSFGSVWDSVVTMASASSSLFGESVVSVNSLRVEKFEECATGPSSLVTVSVADTISFGVSVLVPNTELLLVTDSKALFVVPDVSFVVTNWVCSLVVSCCVNSRPLNDSVVVC
jgi:hypothetical protein